MEAQAQQALEDAGFAFVQVEPRLPELRNYRPDLIAWAGNASGELVPWAAVEIKQGSKAPELVLPQLARYRDLLGTVDHYVVLNGQWFRADDGLRSLRQVEVPQPPRFSSSGELADVGLITSLLASQVHGATPMYRDGAAMSAAASVVRTAYERGIELAPDQRAPVSQSGLFEAGRRLVETLLSREHRAAIVSPRPVLAAAMASLGRQKLGGVVLDPFAGVGSLLWAAVDGAPRVEADVVLHGREMTDALREIAEAVALASPVPSTFESVGDLFAPLPAADLILSLPPFGVRMQPTNGKPYVLLDGSPARDGDFVILDQALRALNPGGRAVILMPSGITFKASGERYRQFLAEHFRVAALIGLDAALAPATSVSTVLMVIDNAAPGETFVAQLAGDWESQLAPGGAALDAALRHVESAAGD